MEFWHPIITPSRRVVVKQTKIRNSKGPPFLFSRVLSFNYEPCNDKNVEYVNDLEST